MHHKSHLVRPHHHHSSSSSTFSKARWFFLAAAFVIIVLFIILQEKMSRHFNPSSSEDDNNGHLIKKKIKKKHNSQNSKKHKAIDKENQHPHEGSSASAEEDTTKKPNLDEEIDDLRDNPHQNNNKPGKIDRNEIPKLKIDEVKADDAEEEEDDTDDNSEDSNHHHKKQNNHHHTADPRDYFNYEVHLSDEKREAILLDDNKKLFDHVDLSSVCSNTLTAKKQTGKDKESSSVKKKVASLFKSNKVQSQLKLPRLNFIDGGGDDHNNNNQEQEQHHQEHEKLLVPPHFPDALMREPLDLKKLSHHVLNHHNKKSDLYHFDLWGNALERMYHHGAQNNNKKENIEKESENEENHDLSSSLLHSGVHCIGKFPTSVSDNNDKNNHHPHDHSSSSCPEALGILVLPPKKTNRDASEFAAFPFTMKSVHDIIDEHEVVSSSSSDGKIVSNDEKDVDEKDEDAHDKSTVSCGSSQIKSGTNSAFLRCVKSKSKVANENQGNHNRQEERDKFHKNIKKNQQQVSSLSEKKSSSSKHANSFLFPSATSDKKPFHIHLNWPKNIPKSNPILPVLMKEEHIEEARKKKHHADNNNDDEGVDSRKEENNSNDKNKEDQEANNDHGKKQQQQQQHQQEPRPRLTLSRIENELAHQKISSKLSKSSSSYSEALGVLINGRGVSKLLLSSLVANDKNDEEADEEKSTTSGIRKVPKTHLGETKEGVIFDSIMSLHKESATTSNKIFNIVDLSKFKKIQTEEEFLNAISSETTNKNGHDNDSQESKKQKQQHDHPLLLHVAASIVISSSKTLVIPEGTTFAIDHARTIEFKCPVKMQGTSTNPIFFTSSKIDKLWGGLVFSHDDQQQQASSSSSFSYELHHTIITNTGGVKSTIKGVGTHIKDACPAIVVRPGVSLRFIDNSAVLSGKGSGITSGKGSRVLIQDAMFFDLAQGGEFVGSETTILRTHALHFMLRLHHDDFLDLDNDGFYFRDGNALVQQSVIFGSRDDCIDTASSKIKNNNDANNNQKKNSSLIILNTVLANCQHEGVALSGSVGALKRNVEIVDSLVRYAQQGVENGHTPSTHVTVLDGVAIEDCGVGLRLGDNYVLNVDGVVDLAGDVEFNRCTLPVLNLLRNPENRHKNWQLDGGKQSTKSDSSVVRISPRATVDGEHVGKYKTFCGREMFAYGVDADNNKVHDEHEVLGIL